jgi:hypothetical protein
VLRSWLIPNLEKNSKTPHDFQIRDLSTPAIREGFAGRAAARQSQGTSHESNNILE